MFAYAYKDALYMTMLLSYVCKVGLIASCTKYFMMCPGIYGCVMTTIGIVIVADFVSRHDLSDAVIMLHVKLHMVFGTHEFRIRRSSQYGGI